MKAPQFPESLRAAVIGLGAPGGYYPVKNLKRTGNLVAFFFFIAGAILVFLYGLYVTFLAARKHGPALIDEKLPVPAMIALVLVLLGMVAAWSAYRNWNRGAAVYERGLAMRDRKGIRLWRWEEVLSMTQSITRHYMNGIYTGTTHVYTLVNRQGDRLVLNDDYIKVDQLAKAIQESIFPILYARAAQQYNAGQSLVFGPVVISKSGIQVGKKTTPWEEVQQVSIQQGILKVSKKGGGWFSGASASASVIPNLNVLLSLIHQVVGLKVG
jgi:hypothetical protein